ncbi:MAG: AAA family ATPase [Eubacterium sp.]|nr:AAA family ATPase [Eubacterium sp.]
MNNMYIKDLWIKWEDISNSSYLRSIPSISQLDEMTFERPVTFFVGENGSGKSTLLEAIAIAYGFNPEGGTKNYTFSTYDSHSELCDSIRLSKGYIKPKRNYFLRAESFYNVATMEEEYSRGGSDMYIPKEFHKKSHGESFIEVVKSYFGANGIYILDEPEAALSPQRQLTLLYEIDRCVKEGSQFIIVTHSPILLGYPDADILSFDEGEIHRIEYEETESYKITEMFINRRDQVLGSLFEG